MLLRGIPRLAQPGSGFAVGAALVAGMVLAVSGQPAWGQEETGTGEAEVVVQAPGSQGLEVQGLEIQGPEVQPPPCIDCDPPVLLDPPPVDWMRPELGRPPVDFDLPVVTFFVEAGEWLDEHPEIRDALVFDGVAYRDWPETDRRAFARIYNDVYWRRGTGLEDPPVNQAELADDEQARTELLRAAAFELFSSYAAQLIALEARDALPWSVLELAPEERRRLFDGRTLFWRLDSFSPVRYRTRSFSRMPASDDNVGRQGCVISYRYVSHALLRHYCATKSPTCQGKMREIYHSTTSYSGLEECLDESYLSDLEAQEALHARIVEAIEAQPDGCETITMDWRSDWANLLLCREIR